MAAVNSNAEVLHGEWTEHYYSKLLKQLCSVADPDPSDPYVFVLLDPDPDPLVRGMDLDPVPDHSITKPK